MEFFSDLLQKKKNIVLFLFIVLTILTTSCNPTKNSSPPTYMKKIVVYKEGYDAIAVYFILADSSGVMTASNGLVTLDISLKRDSLLKRISEPSTEFSDELMNRFLEKEAELHDLSRERSHAVVSAIFRGKGEKAAMAAATKNEKQLESVIKELFDLQDELINRYKASRTHVPKEYFPLFSKTIYLNHFDVKIKDFKNTKVGVGAFEKEALICPVGRIPFSEFAPLFEDDDTGILKVKFETTDGKVFEGEETFSFK